MAPLLPRMHLFEIDDQPWFPPFLRTRVQDALTLVWNAKVPLALPTPAASLCAQTLLKEFGSEKLSSSVLIDFCAGAGGPTPGIARHLNNLTTERVDFILTDLHPNIPAWERRSKSRPEITFERDSVDASNAPTHLTKRSDGKGVIRLFNLAFHHFDDPLATSILKNTIETSQGFAIFEMQDRSPKSFLATCLLPFAVIASAPYYAYKWRSPMTLFFSWIIPIIPFVLWFDGWISGLRTRTPEEVEGLLRGCGADTSRWVVRSGREGFLWPLGEMNWVICQPVDES